MLYIREGTTISVNNYYHVDHQHFRLISNDDSSRLLTKTINNTTIRCTFERSVPISNRTFAFVHGRIGYGKWCQVVNIIILFEIINRRKFNRFNYRIWMRYVAPSVINIPSSDQQQITTTTTIVDCCWWSFQLQLCKYNPVIDAYWWSPSMDDCL